jgi:anti-anti-sigma regulatory factor
MHANMMAAAFGRPSPILIAQQFLRNALHGRAALLEKQSPGSRYRHLRCSERDSATVVSILAERLGASRSGAVAQDELFQELRRELLDAISFARGSVILDLQSVKDMDADGAALLLHLRGRLVGGGGWPSLCGLSQELRAAAPSVPWDDDFRCYASVDAALGDVDG